MPFRLVPASLARALGAAALAGLALTAAAQAEPALQVVMNQAKILKLARPADTIIIGNPAIADAAVQDSSTIVLTGRGFGVTNLVILDREGMPILDEEVSVSRHATNSVRIYRRASVQTLSCSPYCEGAYKSEAERASELEMSISR